MSTPTPTFVSATISAQDTFTNAVALKAGQEADISIDADGSWSGTIVPQRKLAGATDWKDIPNADGTIGFTADTEKTVRAGGDQELRLGAKTGGYSAGTATCAIRVG